MLTGQRDLSVQVFVLSEALDETPQDSCRIGTLRPMLCFEILPSFFLFIFRFMFALENCACIADTCNGAPWFFFFFLGCSTIKHPLHCTLLRRQFGPRVACGASLVSQRWLSFSLSLFIVCRSRAHIFCLLRSPFLLSFFIFCSQLRFYMSACCISH